MLNKAQEKLQKALVLAGMSQEKAKISVESFSSGLQAHEVQYCPRCHNRLIDVKLIGSRKAKYCTNDRITIPYPVNQEDNVSMSAYESYMKATTSSENKSTESIFASVMDKMNK